MQDSTRRNLAKVSLQNRQQHRERIGGGNNDGRSVGGLGASLAAHDQFLPPQTQTQHQQNQYTPQQRQFGIIPQHQQGYRQQQRHSRQSVRGPTTSVHQHHQQFLHHGPNDHMSVGSHYSRGSRGSSHNSSTIEEAFRQKGLELSMKAHGDDMSSYSRPRRIANLTPNNRSGFSSYPKFVSEREKPNSIASTTGTTIDSNFSASASTGNSLNRTTKVAKKRFSDHGDHHNHSNQNNGMTGAQQTLQHQKHGNIVRKMTLNVHELFSVWKGDHAKEKKSHKRSSPSSTDAEIAASDLSPHRKAFSELALDGSQTDVFPEQAFQHGSRRAHLGPSMSLTDRGMGFEDGSTSILKSHNGLLSAVIETASQTSSKTNSATERYSGGDDNGSVRSKESRGSSSIATRSSVGTRNSMVGVSLPQGECLTQPSEAVSNDGMDNAEGNLIVHENDSFSVDRKEIYSFTKGKMKHVQHADFRVKSLLGQGTFAQVFECLHVQTGQTVAVKVIKNRPAYTRQAAEEYKILRTLTKSTPASGSSGKSEDGSEKDSKWDYLVEMICYFMYKGHLCLVFELLGLNLYEVLKKRQFRGLPLTVVRKLVQQAVFGVRELAQKSIIHSDLKPENILLVTDDDVDSVVTAGESKKLSTSLRSSGSLENNPTSKTPPTSTATVATTGENSGNSTSTSNTDNTQKKKLETKEKDSGIEESPSTATTTSHNKTPPTSILSKDPGDWEKEKDSIRGLTSSPTHSEGTNTTGTHGYSLAEQKIKLIDFGSACFEGETSHTYIQSRFYRSPEVLIGLAYDSAIDVWSLGCVAAELFLGLPILPGVHEHDQLSRIREMIGELPDWMIDQGSKSQKYFVKFVPGPTSPAGRTSAPAPNLPQWRMKTQAEFISSLSQTEIKRKGGLAKLEKQPTSRYFKRKRLADIIFHKGLSGGPREDRDQLQSFVHFLYGILEPDPWRRWTAFQVSSHPFLTGNYAEVNKSSVEIGDDENQANKLGGYYWHPPSDPTIYKRKLMNVQMVRGRQQAARQRTNRQIHSRAQSPGSQSGLSVESQVSHRYSESNQLDLRGRTEYVQMSSSYSEIGNQSAMQSGKSMTLMVSGQHLMMSGPQSYSEAGPSGPLPGSFNELDFAYALQRPGVVPMGDTSVSSSTDPTPFGHGSGSDSHSRFHNKYASHAVAGSYGSHRTPHRNQQNALSNARLPVSSRSFEDGGAPLSRSALYSPTNSHQGMMSSSHDRGIHAVPSQIGQNLSPSSLNVAPSPQAIPGTLQAQQPVEDNVATQLYLQQQHAAIQQQQLLLQQQQAALALQQQQLQAYGMNPVLLNVNAGSAAGTLNPQQFNMVSGTPGSGPAVPQTVGGGYYYVSAADGTPILMQAQQFPSQMAGFALPSTGGMIAQQIPNMAGIPGMVQTMPPGAIPGGMVTMASSNNFNGNNTNGFNTSNGQFLHQPPSPSQR